MEIENAAEKLGKLQSNRLNEFNSEFLLEQGKLSKLILDARFPTALDTLDEEPLQYGRYCSVGK